MSRYRSAKAAAFPAALAIPGTCLLVLMCGASAGAQAAESQSAVGGLPPAYDQRGARTGAGPAAGGAPAAGAGLAPGAGPAAGAVPPLSAAPPAADSSLASPVLDGDLSAPLQASAHRPRFSIGVGMGVSLDSTGFVDSRTVAVPAFQVQLGVGEEFLGFELRLFSTQASGRYHQRAASRTMLAPIDGPADRLAIDVLLAVRPFAAIYLGDPRWGSRVVKSVTVNAGAAGENATTGAPAVVRFGSVFGFHIDLPVAPSDSASALSVRITGRRMSARQAYAGMTAVTDTVGELFGGLALSF
ncbi:MAG: hypothetical protein ABJA82_08890 [Myxococcales bacterium]